MKKIVNFLILTSIILLFISCTDDEVRAELPGVPTSLVGNIKDYHRTLNISNFTIKLSKIRGCGVSGNLTPVTCTTQWWQVLLLK